MNSSGIKRGLAISAISALAVAGIPSIASAAPLADHAGGADQVVLYSQFSGKTSVKNDGTNPTVSLTAGAGSDITSVVFAYSLNGTDWVDIATVATRTNGAFTTEWATPAVLNGATVQMRAQGLKAAVVADTDTKTGVQLIGSAAAANTVELNNGPLRVFQQPYGGDNNKHLAIVSGTTSATDGAVALSARSGGATGTASAPVAAGAFAGVLNLAGYSYGSFADASANQIVIGVERDTDDAEAMSIVRQEITTVSVAPGAPKAPAGGTTTVTVKVVDQDGAPITGAQVYDTSGNRLIGYTDAKGEIKDAAAGPGNHTYYANVTSDTAFQAGIDKSVDVTVAGYLQTPTTSSAASKDGNVFDDDEYAAGDIAVTVNDQNGNPVANRNVEYYWDVEGVANVPATGWSTAATGTDGKATVVFPTTAASGSNTLHYRVPADANGLGAIAEKSDLTVIAGQAKLDLTPAEGKAAAGGQVVFTGTLKLDDAAATPLPARDVKFDYTRGTEKAPADATADAGIIAANGTDIVLTRTVATSGTGVVSVTVKDATVADATKQGSELGGKLDAMTAATKDIGNAGASDSSKVDFTSANSLAEIKLTQNTGISMPGRPTGYSVTVTNDDGTPRANAEITVSVDKGKLFQTDLAGSPVPNVTTPISGDFVDATSQTTVRTNASGIAYIAWGIEKDAGFDDDGALVANISVSYQGESKSDKESFFSGNESSSQLDPQSGKLVSVGAPVNVGKVDVSLSQNQQSTILPKASTSQTVNLDFVVTDQFGNRVKMYHDELNDNTQFAYMDLNASQFTGERPAGWARGEQTTDQRIFTVVDSVSDATPVDIQWYEVDYAESDFTLGHDTADVVPVNTAVTETVTGVDQFGQPIPFLDVEFLRSGPSDQDGDVNYTTSTGVNGKATYNFKGTEAGTADISAVVRDDENQIVKLSDKIVFQGATPPPPVQPVAVVSSLAGQNNGPKADVLSVTTGPAASGATVKLYKYVAGRRVLVATKKLAANGMARFRAADRNGRKFTKYVAVVSPTAKTKGDTSNKRSIR